MATKKTGEPFAVTDEAEPVVEVEAAAQPEAPVSLESERLARLEEMLQQQADVLEQQRKALDGANATISTLNSELHKVEPPTPEEEAAKADPIHKLGVRYSDYEDIRDGRRTWWDTESPEFTRDKARPSVGDQVEVKCSEPGIEVYGLSYFIAGFHGSVATLATAHAHEANSLVITFNKSRHYNWLVSKAQGEGLTPENLALRCIVQAWQHDPWRNSQSTVTGPQRQDLMKELNAKAG